ncbi:uncharacterized protein LOC119094130 [Pollicipes pollicipes]|uniref:uncharacterized protein LOC119094130 n=1 Tax=Pollicipes pollicipes TaxID=41117 RepID=UPI001884E767|nr:uncharacterized protein LOC119094130 [Pollicipes pollicipes]
MSALCFVCNLPILSHQVGLVWKGGNGADEYVASQPIPIRRRDSSSLAEAQLKSRRLVDSGSDLKTDISKLLAGRDSVTELWRKRREIQVHTEREELRTRRQSASSSGRRDSKPAVSPDGKYIEPRALIEARQAVLLSQRDDEATREPAEEGVTLSTANVSEGRQSPTVPAPAAILHRTSLPTITPLARGRDARPRACISPEPMPSYRGREPSPKQGGLRRQAAAFDESSPLARGRRGSRPFLSPDPGDADPAARGRRRDSLSPDSAAEEMNQARRLKSRRQSNEESPEGSSTGSSRDPSPNSSVRRQSTTEEILIAKCRQRRATSAQCRAIWL